MIYAFVWSPTEEDKNLYKGLIEAALIEKVKTGLEFVDLASSPNLNIDFQPEDTVIAFGTRCYNLVNSKASVPVTQLPNAKRLINDQVNAATRRATYEKLKKLDKIQPGLPTKTLEPKDLEPFFLDRLVGIKEVMESKNRDYWSVTLKDGRVLVILKDQTINTKEGTFSITFEELFAARMIQDLLGIDKISISQEKTDDRT